MPPNLEFIPEDQIIVEKGVLCLARSLVYGLIVAVVVSPANKDEATAAPGAGVSVKGFAIPLERLWGKLDAHVPSSWTRTGVTDFGLRPCVVSLAI